MNDERRKKLASVIALLDEARGLIDEVKDDEQEAFDNMPEALQQSDKGQLAEDVINDLDNVSCALEGVVEDLSNACGS